MGGGGGGGGSTSARGGDYGSLRGRLLRSKSDDLGLPVAVAPQQTFELDLFERSLWARRLGLRPFSLVLLSTWSSSLATLL